MGMFPPLLDSLILVAAGVVAGIVNAIAGGGTFFTFAALMATGLPPIGANATSAVSVLPGQVASALAYRRELATLGTSLVPLGIVSAFGGLAGGWLLLNSDNTAFQGLVPWLLLIATLLFAISPFIPAWLEQVRRRKQNSARSTISAKGGALVLQGMIAVYGGYFGAGMGIMMLATLPLIFGGNFHAANAAKNILAVLMQGLAVILFLASGFVQWPEAIIITLSSIFGGWLGVIVAKLVSIDFIRYSVIATGASLTFWYFIR
jgi:uncharacterized membrane protein YfcA